MNELYNKKTLALFNFHIELLRFCAQRRDFLFQLIRPAHFTTLDKPHQ